MSNYHGGVKNRQKRALQRLEDQLKSGKKSFNYDKVPLNEHDIKRIEKEISTLKSKTNGTYEAK